jgi:hypothetical protein
MAQINEAHIRAVLNGQRPKAIAEKAADIVVRKIKQKRATETPEVKHPGVVPVTTGSDEVNGKIDPKVSGTGKKNVDAYQKLADKGDSGAQPHIKKDLKAQLKNLRQSVTGVIKEEAHESKKPAPVTKAIDKLAAKYNPVSVDHHTQATGHQHTVVVFKPEHKAAADQFRKAVGTMGWTSSEGKEHDKDVTVIVNHAGINEGQAMFLLGFLHENGDVVPLDYAYAAGHALAEGHDLEEAWKAAAGKRSGAWHPFLTVPAPGGMWMNVVRKTGQHIGGLFRNRVQARQAADAMASRMTATAR